MTTSLHLLAVQLLIQPWVVLAFLASWLPLLAHTQFAGVLSPFSAAYPSMFCCCAAPSQVKDVALVLTGFHEVALGLFLQPSSVTLDGSPTRLH